MKVLVGTDVGSYTFDASAKTVSISGFRSLRLSQILLIANITDNVIIYSPYSPGKGGSIASNVVTLDYDTTGMDDTDLLQVFIDYDQPLDIALADPGIRDIMGRLRTSQQRSKFDYTHTLNASPLLWQTITASGGTVTHQPNVGAARLNVTSTIGSSTVRQQHGYNICSTGTSIQVHMSAVLGTAVTGIRKRVGYFDTRNGLFFEQDTNGTHYIVLRSYVTGAAVDTKIAQSNWNIDNLDGDHDAFNPSGITFNPANVQMFVLEFQWYGKIKFGVYINGAIYYVHDFNTNNNITSVYMSTGSLPMRFEITNVSSGSDSSMDQVSGVVLTDGPQEGATGYRRDASNGVTGRQFNTRQAILSVRLQSTISGNINRGKVFPEALEVTVSTNSSVFYEVVLQKSNIGETTVGGAPTWQPIANSICEQSVNVTTVTGGTVIASGFLNGTTTRQAQKVITSKEIMALNADGTASDMLHLMCTSFSGNATGTGSLNFIEEY